MGAPKKPPLALIDARSARIGGALNFVTELPQPLERVLKARGLELEVFSGPPRTIQERLRRRLLLSRSSAVLHAGNRATWAPAATQVVCVRDRLLLPGGVGPYASSMRFQVRRLLLLHALSVADAIVVPSRSMRQPLRELQKASFALREKPVHVIPHGSPSWDAIPPRSFGEPVRLIFPSHVANHKNFILLAKLLERVSSLPVQLTLTATGEEVIDGRQLRTWFSKVDRVVHFLGAVPRSRLRDLYAAHDILVFPSRVESFGMPLLEGMAMGMPIIASDEEWAHEVCAEAAEYAAPTDVDGWGGALSKCVDRGRRENTVGVNRARSYDWNQSAKMYAELLLE